MSARDLREEDWQELAERAAYDLPMMMQLAPVSPRQVQRIFARKFRRTPREWLRWLKLRRAMELVGQGYATKAIVAELKFSSAPYFCREFKKVFGASPQCYSPLYPRGSAAQRPLPSRPRSDKLAPGLDATSLEGR